MPNMEKVLNTIVIGLTTIVVVFALLAGFSSTLFLSATNISAETGTYGSLVSLFAPGGVLFTVLIAGIFIGLIGLVLAFFLKRKARR